MEAYHFHHGWSGKASWSSGILTREKKGHLEVEDDVEALEGMLEADSRSPAVVGDHQRNILESLGRLVYTFL